MAKKYSDYRDKKEEVWDKGKKMRGKDPDLYRRDAEGNPMYKPSYGKPTEMGWEIDHSKPQSKGGTDHLNNLRPLNTAENRSKGNKKK